VALRFGLLGTGHWARAAHAAGLAASPDVELVGVWGRDPAKAQALAAEHGAASYDDVDTLLADVDAVAIALPPDVQAPLAARAAAAGRHLLLDKPVALDVEQADAVVSEVEARGLASRVFFTARYQPEVVAWLDDVGDDDWHGARATWFGSIYQPGNPYADSAWRRRKGALWDVGPHALAATLPLMGPAHRVTAGRGRGDTVHLVVEHERGGASTLSLSLTVPPAAAVTELVVHGERGVASMPSGRLSAAEAFAVAAGQLADDVAGGSTRAACDVRFGRDVVVVLAAAERSLAEHRAVDLPQDAGAGRAGEDPA
jgi:predicted dehydrogenase